MTYYFFPLTKEEAKNGANLGYRFALQNKSRWVECPDLGNERNTYDPATSGLIYNNTAYFMYRDYHDLDNNWRVWIGTPRLQGCDQLE